VVEESVYKIGSSKSQLQSLNMLLLTILLIRYSLKMEVVMVQTGNILLMEVNQD